MRNKFVYTTTVLVMVLVLCLLQMVNAQDYWNMASNGNATSNSKLGTSNGVPLKLFTNNKMRLYISAAGNVGIGTNAPAYKLHVIGDTNGIYGSGSNYGVYGSSSNYTGVYGVGKSYGVSGNSDYIGVYGSGSNYGLYGVS